MSLVVFPSVDVVKELASRAARTFAGAFAAVYAPVILGAGHLSALVDLSVADKAATAGLAAVASIVLGLLGIQTGDPESVKLGK